MAIFVAIELRSDHPMLDLTLFRKPAFNGVSAVAFCLSAGMFALFLYLTIYMQGVLDFSPLEAGLRFLPLTVLGFVVAPISGALSNRVPIRVLLGIGLALVGVGLLLMHGVSADSEWTTLLVGFLVAGIGIGITNPGDRPGGDRGRPGRRNRGWDRGSTRPSARSGSRPASPALGAVFQSQVDSKLAELLPHAPTRPRRTRRLGRLARPSPRCPGRRIRARGRPRRRRRLRQRLQRDHPDRRDRSPSSAPRSASPWSAPRTSSSPAGAPEPAGGRAARSPARSRVSAPGRSAARCYTERDAA